MIQDKLICIYLCSYKSPKGVTMTGNSNVYKTMWKNGNKEYNEKYICCFFTIWNLKTPITYKCGRVVLFLTSVYFAISKLILLFSYSFHVPCIILSNVYFYIARSMFPSLFNWSQSKASVVNQMSHFFFETQKYFFALFNFENGHIHNDVSRLINVMKLDVGNNSTVSTMSVSVHVETDKVNLTLFNIVNFKVRRREVRHPNKNVETTLKSFLGIDECC